MAIKKVLRPRPSKLCKPRAFPHNVFNITLFMKAILTMRSGFWGPLYYNYNKEPPPKKIVDLGQGFKVEGLGFEGWEFKNYSNYRAYSTHKTQQKEKGPITGHDLR